MVEPLIVPREQHTLSRQAVDPDALKVLYRLHQHHFIAYLVGGSVRDLLLGRRPKDFDVGTSAHPYQVKRLFRNCWIIGRRFRLAHVKFGPKVIEVATFRRQVPAEQEPVVAAEAETPDHVEPVEVISTGDAARDRILQRDNTFGTPEEDAFRRDFTINALFYDIGTRAIIDYVGGLADLKAGIIRSIGDPDVRFLEDPVRMLRAVVLAARLDFAIDPPIYDAIDRHCSAIRHAAPARLTEEFYKILRSGASARAIEGLADSGLLEQLAPELVDDRRHEALRASLEALDRYRRRFESTPDTLTNPVLLGSLVAPLGFPRRTRQGGEESRFGVPLLGMLPVPRKDIERLSHLLALQRRLLEPDMSPRAQHMLLQRSAFRDALTWLEIHGDEPEIVEHWHRVLASQPQRPVVLSQGAEIEEDEFTLPSRPRRRRRRRRYRPSPAVQ